jgi:hypothetical protein
VKVAQYESAGNEAKRDVRPARDDRNIRLWSRTRLGDCQHPSIVPSGTDSSLKTLTQHFVLGYFRQVPTGLIFSNQQLTCAIPNATPLGSGRTRPPADSRSLSCGRFCVAYLNSPTLAQELIDFGEGKTLGKETFQRMAVEELRCELI